MHLGQSDTETPEPYNSTQFFRLGKRIQELNAEVERLSMPTYGCAKRGCDAVNPAWWSFGAHGKSWCLHHRPLRARVRVWWQERRDV